MSYLPEPLTSKWPVIRYNRYWKTNLPIPTGEVKLLKGVQKSSDVNGKSGSRQTKYVIHLYVNKTKLTIEGYQYWTKDFIVGCKTREVSPLRSLPYFAPNAMYYAFLSEASICQACLNLLKIGRKLQYHMLEDYKEPY